MKTIILNDNPETFMEKVNAVTGIHHGFENSSSGGFSVERG